MRKRIPIFIAALLVLGAVIYVVWQRPATQEIRRPQVSPPPAETETEPELAFQSEVLEGEGIEPPLEGQRSRRLDEAEARRIRESVVAGERIPHDVAMDEYKSTLWDEIQANPPQFETPGDPAIDAETAYRLYMYFGNCSVMPRTQAHIDERLQGIQRRAEHAEERYLDRLEDWADRMISQYEMCQPIPPDIDPRMEAINWMTEAVNLGHEIAQAQFYEKAMGFMLRRDRYTDNPPLVMLENGLIEQYKATARYGLAQAIEKGHPESYLAMSQAMYEGVIYPRDPVLAFAYMRAAEMSASQHQIIVHKIEEQRGTLTQVLNQEQIAEAEDLALELWERRTADA